MSAVVPSTVARGAYSMVAVPDVSGASSDDHLFELYLTTRGLARLTKEVYVREIGRFRAHVGKPMAAVTVEDLRSFAASLEEAGLSPGTVSRSLSMVRALFAFAQQTGYLRWNPAQAIRIRRRRGDDGCGRFLTPGEAERMLAAARGRGPRCLAVVACLLGLGLRRAELHAASWGDLFEDGSGRVGLRVVGKGARRRTIKVRPDLWALFRSWRRMRGLPEGIDPSDRRPLVINRDGARLSMRGIQREVAAAARDAGISKPVSPHWLRHSFATLSLSGGAEVTQVRESLGHSSLTTTTIYLHAARGLEDQASDHLPFSIGAMP